MSPLHFTQEQVKENLLKHLDLLQDYADFYDKGKIDFALPMATSMRVILHHTDASRSILNHLNATHINLLSTMAFPLEFVLANQNDTTLRIGSWDGIHIFGDGQVKPRLGGGSTPRRNLLSVPDWLNGLTFIEDYIEYTRKEVIKNTANIGGGAHLGKEFNAKQDKMLTKSPYDLVVNGKTSKIPPMYHASLRQMTWELLNSDDLLGLCL